MISMVDCDRIVFLPPSRLIHDHSTDFDQARTDLDSDVIRI